ncbi:hypothetical protein PHMEG_00033215 [Phytophthora megakarya]|uniref:DOT1 domain-containing protein n=1 Tax=Phytophthora megakarya TaxID=4795 RepID=A0A225UTQ5_9STRA|nr:hypothetical protein PHMEG_00033215 [Phytophthora megakarya]
MADFSDDEDLLLYRLAKAQVDGGHRTNWKRVWQGMTSCGKTKKQLQIRLKTLKKTYGTCLDTFPKRFRQQEAMRWTCTKQAAAVLPVILSVPDAVISIFAVLSVILSVPDAVISIFSNVPRQPVGAPDCHVGEITPASISVILAALPTLQKTDSFVDFGSGIGNVVARVAMETAVGRCIGLEFQENLVRISKELLHGACLKFPNLDKVVIHKGDIRDLSRAVYMDIAGCSFLFANSIVFDPTSVSALEAFTTSSDALKYVVLTAKICGRHRPACQRSFCKVWHLHETITVQVSWSAVAHQAYWYTRRTAVTLSMPLAPRRS